MHFVCYITHLLFAISVIMNNAWGRCIGMYPYFYTAHFTKLHSHILQLTINWILNSYTISCGISLILVRQSIPFENTEVRNQYYYQLIFILWIHHETAYTDFYPFFINVIRTYVHSILLFLTLSSNMLWCGMQSNEVVQSTRYEAHTL